MTDSLDITEYLTPRDVTTLPKRRGREPSDFYPQLVHAFATSGEAAMEVNLTKVGRKPETVRAALAKAIKTGGFQDKIKVSLTGGDVILILR